MTTVVQGRHTCRPLKQSHGARICNSIQWHARSSCTASSGTRPYIQLHLMRARCTSPLESLHNRIDSGATYTSPADTITRTFRPQIHSHVHFARRYNHTYFSPADTITRTFRPQKHTHIPRPQMQMHIPQPLFGPTHSWAKYVPLPLPVIPANSRYFASLRDRPPSDLSLSLISQTSTN